MPLLADFLALFYPQVCAGCDGELLQGEQFVCINCLLSLPYTGFSRQTPNPAEQAFWGRVEIEAGTSFLYFRKGNATQKIMHRIKYKGEKELAEYMGRLMGQELKTLSRFNGIEAVIPVPMHPAKQRKRGFNQSEWFAKGLSAITEAPTLTDVLLKITATESQTKKSRWQRWVNADEKYTLINPQHISGKNVLLVDDTLTTGATLEACAQMLLQANPKSISIATMAFTQ
ncbi:MAG: ComF family protein [Bacteroidota bacterium]